MAAYATEIAELRCDVADLRSGLSQLARSLDELKNDVDWVRDTCDKLQRGFFDQRLKIGRVEQAEETSHRNEQRLKLLDLAVKAMLEDGVPDAVSALKKARARQMLGLDEKQKAKGNGKDNGRSPASRRFN